jgi:hypothetical protein
MRLVVSLATRGRPQQLIETIKRNCACLSRPDTLVMVQIDDDDGPTIEQVVYKDNGFDKRVLLDVQPREDTVAAKWNRALQQHAGVYTIIGDDDPYVVPDTDEKILHAAGLFPDGYGFVYGHLANASFPGIVCLTKGMTELLGYIQPEYFPYWFCDHWTDDIARICGRIGFADVRTDQGRAGKTQEMREPAWWATWFDANYLRRRTEAHRVILMLDEMEWRKKILYSHHPLIEFRSKWINDNVRGQARQLETWSALGTKDERYQRVKQKAVDAVPVIMAALPDQEARAYREFLTPPATIFNMMQRAS